MTAYQPGDMRNEHLKLMPNQRESAGSIVLAQHLPSSYRRWTETRLPKILAQNGAIAVHAVRCGDIGSAEISNATNGPASP
ncbi:hypothetical protein [Novosphingobium sp. PhB55]|uniref:hypothetical protein n=1 Tax=Novosphingobium sp. PhB55 TaxID=2485106 RepID=UPI001066534F|nr:hypothetical protein [Novosphingobium sp. PhB55]